MSLRDLWADLSIPAGVEQTPAARAATAAGHGLIGLAVGALPVVPWWAWPAVYFAAKEWRDIRRGGGWRDSVIDTVMVGTGAALAGVIWGPVVVLALAGADGAWGKKVRDE